MKSIDGSDETKGGEPEIGSDSDGCCCCCCCETDEECLVE
jgi:hypothetical protein